MKPQLEINIPLNSGEIERWGLATDDSCVVVLRLIDGEWQQFRAAYIPSYVAVHMSALAAENIAQRDAYDAAFQIMYGSKPERESQSAAQTDIQ